MNILPKLASSLNRRDEEPNKKLAVLIARNNDKAAVKELVELLFTAKPDIQSDCIKVLYEAGALKPGLIAANCRQFIELLDHKNNRLQWGAMTALSSCVLENPKAVFAALPKIVDAADKGTVITKDHCVNILAKLCTLKPYANRCFALLNEQILKSPVNQLPSYVEKTAAVIAEKDKRVLLRTIAVRMQDVEQGPKKKRMEKVVRQLTAGENKK